MKSDQLSAVFNEWAKRYAANPSEFEGSCLDADGKPIEDYGDRCAVYFAKLSAELFPMNVKN